MDAEAQQLRVESARLALMQLQNRIPQRELNLQHAEAELIRLDARFSNGIAVEQEFDQARFALLDEQTELKNLLIKLQLSHTGIRAPAPSTIISIDETAPVVMYSERRSSERQA